MRNGVLSLAHGALRLPAFLPDATLGVVRAVDAADLERAGIDAVVMNVFHLMQKPGSSTVAALGDRGITFQPEGAERKFQLTPEKSVQLQIAYGADVVICLDDCTHADDPL